MNIHCPHCQALYRIDPGRIPAGGVQARCARCGDSFPVGAMGLPAARPEADGTRSPAGMGGVAPNVQAASGGGAAGVGTRQAPPAVAGYAGIDAGATASAPPASAGPRGAAPFAAQDPNARAHRIARALVSDIVAYNRERRERSLAAGTLRTDFREEIMKSWQEYVEQVGQETAKNTPYFRDSLNELLAKGQQVF